MPSNTSSSSSTAAACSRSRRYRRASSATTPATRTRFASTTLPARGKLLAEAGYKNGIDPATNTRLKLSFDTSATTASAGLPLEFLAAAWREIGLDIEINVHHLQSIPGQGPPRRLSDLHLGLGRRLPGPGEFLLPARVSERALQERRAQYGGFLRCGVRPALPRDEVPAQRRAPRRSHSAHARRSWSGSAPGSSSTTARTSC